MLHGLDDNARWAHQDALRRTTGAHTAPGGVRISAIV